MAFMARLRTAAGESPLALRFTFMSRLRLVRRKWTRAAADSAVASARRGRNGGLLTLRRFACEQRVRVAGEAADRPQRHVADDAGDAEIFIVDQRAGELLVGREIRANEARHVIDGTADLPALDDVVDGGEALFEPAAVGLPLQDDFGEDVDRPRQPGKLDHGLISGNDARGLEAPHPFERRPRRQPHRLRQFLDGRAAVALKRGENLDVDLIQCWRALGGHEVCVLRCAAISFSERVPLSSPRTRGPIFQSRWLWVPAFAGTTG